MSIKSDRWIREMASTHKMIEPFAPQQVRTNGDGKIASVYREIARNTAARLALHARSKAIQFPKIVIQNT